LDSGVYSRALLLFTSVQCDTSLYSVKLVFCKLFKQANNVAARDSLKQTNEPSIDAALYNQPNATKPAACFGQGSPH